MPQESIRSAPADAARADIPDDSHPRRGRQDDPAKLVIVANAPLIGVPAAYTTSQSVLVTVLAAVVATVFLVVYAVHYSR